MPGGSGVSRSMTSVNLALVGVQRNVSKQILANALIADASNLGIYSSTSAIDVASAAGATYGQILKNGAYFQWISSTNSTGARITGQATGVLVETTGGGPITIQANGALALYGTSHTFGSNSGTGWGLSSLSGSLWQLSSSGSGATGVQLNVQSGGLSFSASGTQVALYSLTASGACSFSAQHDSTWTFTQGSRASDLATKDFTFRTQAPFATATGANRTPGNFPIYLNVQTNGGTSGVVDAAKGAWRWEDSGSAVLRRLEYQADRKQTTDATANQKIAQRTVPNNTCERWDVRVVAYTPATGDSASYWRTMTVKKVGAAAVGIVGIVRTPVADDEDAALVGADVTLQTPGGAIGTVVATGVAATTIEWAALIDAFSMTP